MRREEHLQKMADISNEWRQMDIQIGVEQERERITQKLLYVMSKPDFRWDLWLSNENDLRLFLNEDENK